VAVEPGSAAVLWLAVLENAIQALRGKMRVGRDAAAHFPNRRDLAIEAREWVIAEDDEPLGTFASICRELGLPTQQVRADLLAIPFVGQTRREPRRVAA